MANLYSLESLVVDEDTNVALDDRADDFEGQVAAEAQRIQRTLTAIKQRAKERSDSSDTLDGSRGSPVRVREKSRILDNATREDEDVRKQLFESIPAPTNSSNYQRVVITSDGDAPEHDTVVACRVLKKCLELREKWMTAAHTYSASTTSTITPSTSPPTMSRVVSYSNTLDPYRRREEPDYNIFDRPLPPATSQYTYELRRGVFVVTQAEGHDGATQETPASDKTPVFSVYSFEEFIADFLYLRHGVYSGPVKSYSYKRLEFLYAKFNLHVLLNDSRENDCCKSVPHRDFYNVRKVDTHVHHSACMNQKHLLRFIKNKLRNNPQEVVVFRDGQFMTLGEVFKSLRLTAYDLSIDTLDMHANNTFHRFDRFNLKYNPAGQSRLREIFLKTDNMLGGQYLADITKEIMEELESSKYQLVEWRISIYGRKASEWGNLARWFYVNRLAHKNVRWLIQVPRLFHIYRKGGEIHSFAEMIHNIFAPLFEVTLNPQSNIPLHYFLETVVGFDSVDDESRPEHGHLSSGASSLPQPSQWTAPENPPYGYWLYYMYANMCVLNQLRAARGLTTFQFRPHCGEAGDVDHLLSAYLLANQVNHGLLLRKTAGLHYLYYLSQVGIAMSPLSNNKLFLDYNKNPFPKYFRQGLNVSLSTDDPLMLHYTKDPLVEEYSVATQVWKLSTTDQCEIARNSVLQSGWEDFYKRRFLGEDYSDIRETNVPLIRLRYCFSLCEKC